MSNREHLIEQKILEYESRLKHIDELINHAENLVEAENQSDELENELSSIKSMRAQLMDKSSYIDNISSDNWRSETIENSGPMAIWDAVAQKIEELLEKLDAQRK